MPARIWLAAALATLAGIALFTLAATPVGHSYGFNMGWTVAFTEALGWTTPYPRHLPGLWEGLGGLDFFFYGPLPFHVAAGPARWLCPGCSPQTVFGLAGGLLWAASGPAFWLFARRLLPPGAALVAAAVWMAMPYHVGIDWVVRQAAGEFAAYVFLPLVGHGLVVALEDRRTGWSLPLGTAGLTLCHLPTVLLAVHVLGLVVLLRLIAQPRATARALPAMAAGALAGLALAGLYWLPALVLLGDVSPEGLYTEALSPAAWYLFGPGVLPDTLYKAALLACQIAGLALAAVAVGLAAGADRTPMALWALLPAGIALALNSSLSAPLWDHWIIARVQFPSRLTVFSDWGGALAAGALAGVLLRPGARPARGRAGWLAGAALVTLLGAALAVAALTPQRLRDGLANRAAPVAAIGAPEYLPPALFAPALARMTAAGRPIWDMPWAVRDIARAATAPGSGVLRPTATAPRRWEVAAPDAPDAPGPWRIALPYWRHLRAETGDATAVALRADPASGLAEASPPAGTATLRIALPRHWSETAGAALSALGLAATLACGLGRRRRRQKD